MKTLKEQAKKKKHTQKGKVILSTPYEALKTLGLQTDVMFIMKAINDIFQKMKKR